MLKITDPSLLNDLPQNNRFIGTLPTLDNSSIIFNGKNNILYCDEHIHLTNSILTFNGNNSVIYLCRNKHLYKLDVVTYNNSAFYVGQNNYFNGKLSAILSEQKHIFIGDDGLFSFGIWMRIADPHLIYHTDSKKRINPTKSIYLGDHVWIGQSAMILKGTQIHSGSIIGALSVVSGKEIPSNTSWAGNPSRKIAENIFGLINVSILGLIIRPLKIMSAKPMPIHITMILKNLLHFHKSIKNLQMLLILKSDMLI